MAHNYFAGSVAAHYDENSAEMFDPAAVGPAVDFLASLAGAGPALELGIGTGRLALPLSKRGIAVHGIDLSAEMVDQLRAKPGAERIEVTIGDFAQTKINKTFGLAYLVFNTITNLTTQDAQVTCFRTVAEHLEPGGRFVIEVFVPILQRLPPGENTRIFHFDGDGLSFDEYDVASQTLFSHHYTFSGSSFRRFSIPFRYVWPAELDLMARIAGLTLTERWSDWHRTPFTSESTSHISVWTKPIPGTSSGSASH